MPTAPKRHSPSRLTKASTEKQWASRQNGSHDLYNLWLWRKPGGLRQQVLWRDPLCKECERQGLLTPATEADHIEPHGGDFDRFMDIDGVISAGCRGLCKACHSRKTLEDQRRGVG